jgi:hypothetical protein
METLQDLRDEYQREGVGTLLRELLAKIVWSTVRQYPPAEYSMYDSWDQSACEDVLNDWIAERLWGRADLQVMLLSAPAVAQFRAALTTSLRQYITNKRRRSVASNLYKRVRLLLRSDSRFRSDGAASLGSEQRWTLVANKSSSPSSLPLGDLVEIASELTDDQLQVVRYGPFSQKLSPILREPKLLDFLSHLLSRADGSLTVGTILDVMRSRFSLPIEEHTELDENIPTPKPNPAEEAVRAVAARSVVSRLGLEDAHILAGYFRSGGNFSEVARECRCTVDRVSEVVHRAFATICECSESEDDARSIMNVVESLLIQFGDNHAMPASN